ncbi:unnamed protein product [Schistosoma mattheei]|uniref:Uncharacterized protein n=1 Tax=Schistosoma mattheei TaxID=31246 RepID=A0A183NUS1_9TREM|nr:unnamed protein product [Schistosoma mattheei]
MELKTTLNQYQSENLQYERQGSSTVWSSNLRTTTTTIKKVQVFINGCLRKANSNQSDIHQTTQSQLANSNQSDIHQTTQSQLDIGKILTFPIDHWRILLILFGVSLINNQIVAVLKICFKFTLKKWCLSKRKTLRQAGEWAVVTGASSGIGEAYAEELAKEGLNIMLISNDEEQLSVIANQIANTYNVQTRIVVADFTKLFAGEVDSPNEESIKSIIHCNILSTLIMTNIILPKMLTQKGPNPGIINIGSYSGLKVYPHATLYSSTKASIIQFSRCLAAEKYKKNVIIQTICPLCVSTNMTNLMKTTYFIPTAKVFAKSALDMFGVEQQTTGYFRHDLKAYLYDLLPTIISKQLMKLKANSQRNKA